MDTSPEYIKQCEKAVEIQEIADDYIDEFSVSCWHSPNHVRCKGHFADWHMGYKYCPVCSKPLKITPEICICHRMKTDETIWLPRQDQLQEMVGCADIQVAYHRLLQIAPFWLGKDLQSMEQLWLAFVMKEKYNKYWTGEDWENNGGSK